jgi:hypothetical protein
VRSWESCGAAARQNVRDLHDKILLSTCLLGGSRLFHLVLEASCASGETVAPQLNARCSSGS